MERYRLFYNMAKGVGFSLWCEKNGIKTTGIKMLGGGATVEVDYIATEEQERTIPEAFCKW